MLLLASVLAVLASARTGRYYGGGCSDEMYYGKTR